MYALCDQNEIYTQIYVVIFSVCDNDDNFSFFFFLSFQTGQIHIRMKEKICRACFVASFFSLHSIRIRNIGYCCWCCFNLCFIYKKKNFFISNASYNFFLFFVVVIFLSSV